MMRSGSAPSLPAARNRGLRHVRTMRQLKLPVGQAGVRLAAAHPTSLCNRSAASQGARPATEPEESGHLGGPVARGCPATPAQQHPSVAIPPRSRGVVAAEFIPPFMDGGALPACRFRHTRRTAHSSVFALTLHGRRPSRCGAHHRLVLCVHVTIREKCWRRSDLGDRGGEDAPAAVPGIAGVLWWAGGRRIRARLRPARERAAKPAGWPG